MKINLGIGLPLVNSMSHTSFWDSWVRMQRPDFVYLRPAMPCHPDMEEIRNSLAMQALESDCTHLLMMDTDQVYPPDAVLRLVEWARNGLDIVCAKVHRRYPPFDPLLMRADPDAHGKYLPVSPEEWGAGGLVEVDATGTGCMLINCEVFEVVEWPWFRVRREYVGDGYRTVGEDVSFCQKAKEAGYKIHVDCGIKVAHLADLWVDEGTFALYRHLEKVKQQQ